MSEQATADHITLRDAAADFLAQERIAVAGVSRDASQPANLIYRRLRDAGHTVFAVNPHADEVEGDRCFHTVAELPAGIDGMVIATPADQSAAVVEACAAAAIPRVWLHRGLGPGSLTDEAVAAAERSGLSVIPGGCPNMFGETSDAGHRGMLRVLQATGKVSRCADAYCCLVD